MKTFKQYIENNDMQPVKEDPSPLLFNLILKAWKDHKSETLDFIRILSKKDESIKDEMGKLLSNTHYAMAQETENEDKPEVSPAKSDSAAPPNDSGF